MSDESIGGERKWSPDGDPPPLADPSVPVVPPQDDESETKNLSIQASRGSVVKFLNLDPQDDENWEQMTNSSLMYEDPYLAPELIDGTTISKEKGVVVLQDSKPELRQAAMEETSPAQNFEIFYPKSDYSAFLNDPVPDVQVQSETSKTYGIFEPRGKPESSPSARIYAETSQPGPSQKPRRASVEEDIKSREITPEDIFNEVKVARMENEAQGQPPSQNLHSYIISKTFSSENVVVLLNLRRLPDGEWVLDKTIAQGLRPETYGGVVSIDQYDFQDPSVVISKPPSSPAMPSQMPPDVANMLKRIEAYVLSVNAKVDNLANAPTCCGVPENPPPIRPPPPPLKDVCVGGELVNSVGGEPTLLDNFTGLLRLFGSDEGGVCNECTGYDPDTTTAIVNWMKDMIGEIASFTNFTGATTNMPDISAAIISKSKLILDMAEEQTNALLAQSKALLEQVQSQKAALISQSKALLEQVKSTNTQLMGEPSVTSLPTSSTANVSKEGLERTNTVGNLSNPTKSDPNSMVTLQPARKDEDTVSTDGYDINIESTMSIDELLQTAD